MGVYNIYGENGIQLKVEEEPTLHHYKVGDGGIELPNGVYVGHEGVAVIKDGVFIAEFDHLISKWGDIIKSEEVLQKHNLLAMEILKLRERECQRKLE